MTSNNYQSVSDINQYIKNIIEDNSFLRYVSVTGEISNFSGSSKAGHWYFTLKDSNSAISVCMFAGKTKDVSFTPKDGMKVFLKGSVSVYKPRGNYQLIITEMKQDGLGDLFLKFEQLKDKLLKEGLFDQNHKRLIPKIARRIIVMSAPGSAALSDIMRTLRDRFPIAKVYIVPIKVQGKGAYLDIINNLKAFDNQADLIILARGGGSIEDLWNFNEEELARTIYNCHTPIITGVGHETDTTIVDFVSDLRALTPTDAAVKAVPNIRDLISDTENLTIQLNNKINQKLILKRTELNKYQQNYHLNNPDSLLTKHQLNLVNLDERLNNFVNTKLTFNYNLVRSLTDKLFNNLNLFTINQGNSINKLETTMEDLINQRLTNSKTDFIHAVRSLKILSPLNTIERGFGIVSHEEKIITSISDVNKNQQINIQLSDGSIIADVRGVNNEKKY